MLVVIFSAALSPSALSADNVPELLRDKSDNGSLRKASAYWGLSGGGEVSRGVSGSVLVAN